MSNRPISAAVLLLLVMTLPASSGCDHQPEDNPAPQQSSAIVPDEKAITRYPNDDATPSFAAVLADPARFDGERISVSGFIHVEFEGNAIYFSKDHADHLITENGFWVNFDKRAVPYEGSIGPEQFHRKWVHIEGTFDRSNRGHFGSWSGTIQDVDRIYECERYNRDED